MSSLSDNFGFLLADLSRLMRARFKLQLTDSELTHSQARALLYLSRHQGTRQVELAELLNIQPITLARILDQLAEQGLIERRPDPSDRRAHRLHLTDAATPHLEAIEDVIAELRAQALQGIAPKEAEQVMQALSRIRDNLANVDLDTDEPTSSRTQPNQSRTQ